MAGIDDLLGALANYPAPAQVVLSAPGAVPRVEYAPPVQHAMALYSTHFQKSPQEPIILDAFAEIGAVAVAKSSALVAAELNRIADAGAPPPGAAAEALNLARDLGTIATALASLDVNSPHRQVYLGVCKAMETLFSMGWCG